MSETDELNKLKGELDDLVRYALPPLSDARRALKDFLSVVTAYLESVDFALDKIRDKVKRS
jgi:hypothetical protein